MPISGSPVTANSPTGLPISADYTSDKSGPPEKVFISPVTKNGPLGIPVAAYDTSTNIIERRDTVFTLNTAGRSGDVGVDDNDDNVVAYGLTGGAYSNSWFNTDWFNAEWFNANWFNTALTTSGDAVFTEDGDDVSSTGRVGISGDADITEADDTLSTYGSAGNDISGTAYVDELIDSPSITGRVIVGLTASIEEDDDSVFARGGVFSGGESAIGVQLSWSIYGAVTGFDIYKSTDNVTFSKIASLPVSANSYIDNITGAPGDIIYYYITGTKTTGQKVQSSSATIQIPRTELVPDPDFDDPAAWNINPVLDAEVVGGELVINSVLATANISPVPATEMQFGVTYNYEIVVEAASGSGISVFMNGSSVWDGSDGTGTFTGSFVLTDQTPVIPDNGYQLLIDYASGSATFSKISIFSL